LKNVTVSRRRFLSSGLVASGVASMALKGIAQQSPACVLIAEQEQGPFYLDRMVMRKAIAEDRTGIPLLLRLKIQDSKTCAPLVGAAIDLWHCDALGLYSGFTKSNMGMGGPGGGRPGGPGGPPPNERPDGPPPGMDGRGGPPPAAKTTDTLTFLRGIQITGKDGSVAFETIFPGFYDGRTNHVHFKVRLAGERTGDRYEGGHTSHTGQVFFPEDWNIKLMANPMYAAHKIHRTTEQEDGVFTRQHGEMAIATLLAVEEGKPEKGLVAQLTVAVDPTATPKPVGVGGVRQGVGSRG
jgi:protocatechuate 3,4-dioxygenase beta subunit